MNSDLTTAHKNLTDAFREATEAEWVWLENCRNGTPVEQSGYNKVQEADAKVILWRRVIENAELQYRNTGGEHAVQTD